MATEKDPLSREAASWTAGLSLLARQMLMGGGGGGGVLIRKQRLSEPRRPLGTLLHPCAAWEPKPPARPLQVSELAQTSHSPISVLPTALLLISASLT